MSVKIEQEVCNIRDKFRFILDVMPESDERPHRWTALLIDVDPDEFVDWRQSASGSQWLGLGDHDSRDDAWDYAEQILAGRFATKH